MRAKEPQDDVEVSLGKAKSTLFLYSTVSAKHKEKSLFFGSAWAFFGVLILTIAGTQIPKDILITYGWLIFLIGGGMIGCGLVPYAKWRNLDRSPHRLTCENSHILFFLHGSPTYSVSSDSISHTAEASRGIKVWLKPGHLPAPLNSRLSIEETLKNNRKRYGCDLFFPHFTAKSLDRLNQWLSETTECRE